MKFLNKMSSDTKVKILQGTVWVTTTITLLAFWDVQLFLIGLACGWFLWLAGVNGSLHKYSSHKTFIPKNKVAEVSIHLFGTLCALGSNISWAATHRKHHQFSDTAKDPHSIHNHKEGLWNTIWHGWKMYWYYFPTYHINPRTVKDLTVDPMHKWFHKNYYKVHMLYVIILALIDPLYVGYFWALPAFYVHTGISYITVTAHSIWFPKVFGGYCNFDSKDKTFNWTPASLLFAGEGNHNNHHAFPANPSNRMGKYDIDLGYWYIKMIGKVKVNTSFYQKFYT